MHCAAICFFCKLITKRVKISQTRPWIETMPVLFQKSLGKVIDVVSKVMNDEVDVGHSRLLKMFVFRAAMFVVQFYAPLSVRSFRHLRKGGGKKSMISKRISISTMIILIFVYSIQSFQRSIRTFHFHPMTSHRRCLNCKMTLSIRNDLIVSSLRSPLLTQRR